MKIVLSALHFAYVRNFESSVRALADRGHDVHLAADEPEALGGRQLAERLAAEYPGSDPHGRVTFGLAPSLEEEPWFGAARRLRLGLDYVRALDPRYQGSPKLRVRAWERAPRIVRWTARVPVAGPAVAASALTRVERWMPQSTVVEEYLRDLAPDVLVLASLTYSRSCQLDLLKGARCFGIPVAAAIMSWDHLSSKALLHLAPDMVLVWNDVQHREAVEMHGLPDERIVTTGAHSYDHWFDRVPSRSAAELAASVGLRADRPFLLYVCSALSPTPEPPEPALVRRWIEALRASGDPALREVGVLVRPHPERVKEWAEADLDGLENVAVSGSNPIDERAKADYFDALFHSRAVIGLVTSAFLEAAILGKPVLTFTLPEYRLHQEEMVHFQYLTTVEGGLLQVAPDLPVHVAQLRAVLAGGEGTSAQNRRFVQAFVRPAGLGRPAAPLFADAIERLHHEGTRADPGLEVSPAIRTVVAALAARGRAGLVRWLLIDPREDAWDGQRIQKQRSRESRAADNVRRRRAELRERSRRIRHDEIQRRAKWLRRRWRMLRHRAGVFVHRVLVAANLRRDLPHTRGER